jgi:hypothetical protein
VGDGSTPHITKNESERATGVITQIGHARTNSSTR